MVSLYHHGQVATTGAVTIFAHREVDRQRRPLQGCTAASLDALLPTLRASGVGVVDGLVDQRLLSSIKATAVYQSMPKRYTRTSAGAVGRTSRRGPPAPPTAMDLWPTSARGRYHRREESFNDADLKVFEELEQTIWPLVVAFFQDDDEPRGAQDPVFRSELQVPRAARYFPRRHT